MSTPERPHWGFTRHHKLPVYSRAVNHLPNATAAQRVNKWLAVKITDGVATMWCAYIFAIIALISLPGTLEETFTKGFHPIPIVQWLAQTFLQLVLLSVIMVGQAVLQLSSDARAAKTFEDIEDARTSLITVLDRLDCETEGGLAAVIEEVRKLRAPS
jgi:hypothetical protein